MTKRAYKYRFYPTFEQETLLAQTFGLWRFVYNHILRWRTDEYYQNGNSINYNQASKKLTELKKNPDCLWLKDVFLCTYPAIFAPSTNSLQELLGGRTKYPTFKKRHAKQSATFAASAFSMKEGQLFIAKSKEPLNIRWSRELLPSLPVSPSARIVQADILFPCSASSTLNQCPSVTKQWALI